MKRRLPIAIVLAALALPAFPAGAADSEVKVGNFFYRAAYVRVDPGETVTWRILDGSAHTVTTRRGAPVRFDSGGREPGETYEFTFTEPGRYAYTCTFHPNLGQNGVVQVGPDTTDPVLRALRAKRSGRRVRVSFGLSEGARVKAVLKRGRKTLKTVRTRLLEQGRRSVRFVRPKRLAPGRYAARLVATDRDGNSSRRAKVTFVVPKPR